MPGTFAAHDDLARSPVDIVDLHGDHFRWPQPETGEQQHHGVVALTSGRFGANRPEKDIHLLGYQMPWQPRPISLCNAWDAQGEIGRRLAGLEKISEEVPQMRGRGLVPEWRRPRSQVLQKSHDVGEVICDRSPISSPKRNSRKRSAKRQEWKIVLSLSPR